MSFLTDHKFVNYISSQLEGFTWERPNLGRSRCPFCGDSAKKTSKRRFYIYQSSRPGFVNDGMSCYCHNCTYAKPFNAFLKEFDSHQYNAYRMENFQENNAWKQFIDTKPKEPVEATKPLFPMSGEERKVHIHPPHCVTVQSLPADHYCRQYVEGRQIKQLDLLWFTEDFNAVVKDFADEQAAEKVTVGEPRLVIPFMNEKGEVVTLQGRSFDPKDKIRYLTYKSHSGASKIYGLERINRSRTVVVVEGPIDSLFIPNCVATADSNLLTVDWGDIYIPDAQYRNIQIVKFIDKIIDKGKRVTLFPESIVHKDINDMITKGGMTQRDVLQLIAANTFQGAEAAARFGLLKKV